MLACWAASHTIIPSLLTPTPLPPAVLQPYHRSNFCLVGRSAGELAAATTQLARAALELLDLRQHDASHPRLGVVDHISCHPLVPSSTSASEAQAGMQAAASLARAVGQELGSCGSAVPVYVYAAAHPQQQQLASIRRSLGYFRGAAQGELTGSPLLLGSS